MRIPPRELQWARILLCHVPQSQMCGGRWFHIEIGRTVERSALSNSIQADSAERTSHHPKILKLYHTGLWPIPLDGSGICTTDVRCKRQDFKRRLTIFLIRGSSRMILRRLALPLSWSRA